MTGVVIYHASVNNGAGDGTLTFTSRKNKKSGDFVFTVTNVTASGYDYDAALNVETSDSIPNT